MESAMARKLRKEWETKGRADLICKIIETLKTTYGKCSDLELASKLDLSEKKIANWKHSGACQKGNVESLVNAIIKHAIRNSYIPLAELKPIKCLKNESGYEINVVKLSSDKLKKIQAEGSGGIYIFYDSRGKAIYAGQSRKGSRQSLWKEINAAYNRERTSQTIICNVSNQLRKKKYYLYEVAHYITIYLVHEFAIKDFESLLIRSFPNDLTNIRMERKSQGLTLDK